MKNFKEFVTEGTRAKCPQCEAQFSKAEQHQSIAKNGACIGCHQTNELVDANIAEIKKHYGKKRADQANIGWGMAHHHIESKVYGLADNKPTMIVVTNRNKDGSHSHEHSEY